ncbi:MAG: HAD-IA family hydrolase [Actinomycetota bacterium]|nr:HAD-IA family hydrolase [Actinomycetota bacterium]
MLREGLLVDCGGVPVRLRPRLLQARGTRPGNGGRRFREDRECRDLLVALETGKLQEVEFERRFGGAGVRTGMVSNSWSTRRYDRAMLAELFDGVVISGEVGERKPAPEIYTLGAKSIGLEPSACVFVDDLPFNLTPAAELGMATVHHRHSGEMVDELGRLFGVSLR